MITIEQGHLGLIMEAGYIYIGMSRFKEARKVFDGLSVLAPASELPLISLGNVFFCEGKFQLAIKEYNKALKMNPESDFAHAYLGEVLFFMKKKEEAIKELKKAKEIAPKGKAAIFADSLLAAIKNGFTPAMVAGVTDKE